MGLSRIIERPPIRVFLLLSPSFHALQRICSVIHLFKNMDASSPPSRLGDLVQEVCCSCSICLWVTQLTSRDLLSNAFLLLAFYRPTIFPIKLFISNGVQTRALSKSFASVPLTHHCSFKLTLPEYSQADCVLRRMLSYRSWLNSSSFMLKKCWRSNNREPIIFFTFSLP